MGRNRLLALVMVLAAVVFAIGAALERSDTHDEPAATAAAHVEAESGEAEEGEAIDAHEDGSEGEEILGIDPESTPVIMLAVIGSLAFAAAVWLRPDLGWLLLALAVAMLALAVLDLREVVHQVSESNGGVAVFAGIVAVLHLLAAGLAFSLRGRPGAARPESTRIVR